MECVNLGVPSSWSFARQLVPLFSEFFQIVVHVWLELTDALRAEGMRHYLAFAGMLCSVAGIEKTACDGDEGIVVLT